ncbi:hypothetical protein [Megasphaera cerevisiae]|uniref:hypothetical protein n=1 Tax=Megasphaera cerevisiae TaxID=39029 RepID=UPI001356572D|nr:hypothetical protein [Megasphaera cerevisiae]
MNQSKAYAEIVRKSLPVALSEEHGKKLAERLSKRCKFAPSIAEIMEEWKQMRREIYREASVYHPEPRLPYVKRQTLQQAQAVKISWHEGKRVINCHITAEVREFVHTFFPEMSDDTIRKNWLEIMNCQKDRVRELAQNSRWRTYMKLNTEGNIELVMRKIA